MRGFLLGLILLTGFAVTILSLRPGGLLVFKTYTQAHPELSGGKGPTHPMHLLDSGELLSAFEDLQIISYRETVTKKGVAELVARKC